MIYRIYESRGGVAIAVADKELVGKTLKFNAQSKSKDLAAPRSSKEASRDIEFFVNPRFYGDTESPREEIIKLIKSAVNINLVGNKAVAAGKEAGMVKDENIIMIGKVPHAQAVVIL